MLMFLKNIEIGRFAKTMNEDHGCDLERQVSEITSGPSERDVNI